ncbi:MAG: ribonuclease inhibitor [Stenotrophomonas acidaminiphila]|nr:MAG: ribonuclease inhibitor [Stenotrophomonas acidaminiphila]
MSLTLTLDGARIRDIPSFYDEINRVFMTGVDWTLGPSLDALDDLLYGGYGALDGAAPATLVWTDFAASRDALGVETTRQYLLAKLAQPGRFNRAHAQHALDALDAGRGQTYFDIVLEIIAAHPNITLVPDEPANTVTPWGGLNPTIARVPDASSGGPRPALRETPCQAPSLSR